MRKLLCTAAFLALSTGFAAAQINPETVAGEYTTAGYTRVEVKVGPTQMKVEAIRGTEKIEVVYDIATGEILKSETGVVGTNENTSTGVVIRSDDDDFVDGAEDDDSHSGGTDDDSDDDGSDDSDDDNGGDDSDDDGSDDSDDDHGGDDDDGSDDDGGDDDGGDDGDDD